MAGPASELSTSKSTPRSWASSARAERLATRNSGLVIVSTTIMRVLGSDGLFDRRQVAGIDDRAGDAASGRLVDQKLVAAAIEPAADDQMIAHRGLRDHGQRQGPHAAGRDRGPLGRVKLAAFFGQQVGIGMPIAAIGVAGEFAGQQGGGLFGRLAVDRRSTTGSAA